MLSHFLKDLVLAVRSALPVCNMKLKIELQEP